MKKAKKIAKTTDNSREYKMAIRYYLGFCPYCSPHRGCNRDSGHWKRRSWKNYRKTQYKDVFK